ncbi:TPA: AAA family ATPase [Pseudomonas aeruginosa]|uniref:IS21-like element helper ATPase IstB n=1 Tax=Pseudomonas aeruginosa TaxID=287 RepID=UPI0021F23191|nr:IS21-like element helper ATPase IstB [Pseudomonas aeruginosa]MCT5439680.1 IS21-like element helper ATPase IstB [Pseudomonas aeruginosa]MCV6099215.1 IS21-like element helper ATPase IstB [Pseudomonas aeruginosa]MDI2197511.1 IS21-like element helper ATPase IstB [Pseudomonas aeruginosa]MDY1161672.1 IS21-like element helper ATPase IstB [Pseudomonas aeruginosa]HBO4599507.1 IS21-like element helper ATPase IstB [Pseudomonas aeruginosa]
MSHFSTPQRLIELGLHGMANAYERQLNQPQLQQEAFDVRLGLMLDAENSSRESRKIERLVKAARLRESQAVLEDIDFKASRGLDRSTVMNLAECEWLRRRQNLILTGATGTGKTWLACAFGNQACRQGFTTGYRTATQLFEDILLSQADNTLPKLRRQLIRTHLLIIDDLGIGGISAPLGPLLLEIIDQQSRNGSLLITSQYPQEKWYELFADPTIADAILDRIIHKSHTIQLKGESMRKVRAKRG